VLLWLLLLTAAARPQWVGEPLPIAASGRDLLVAVDVSGSMDFPDMQWQDEDVSRLDLVKSLLGDFLENREGDRVGLILFGSQAYLQAPLTFDRHTVRTWLDEARIGIAGQKHRHWRRHWPGPQTPAPTSGPEPGADPGHRRGQQRRRRSTRLTAARLAAEEGVKIYPIGIGADPEDSSTKGLFGLNPGVDLDEPALQEIARLTGGQYFRAHDGKELAAIKHTLDQLEPVAQQPTQARPARRCIAGHWQAHCC
jgi:Ca-activated chloride channel homolog